jgi:type I restriction enzyme S subunit
MSLARYPKYKDSGVEWLGQVPEHWESIRFKNVFEEKFVEAGGALPLGSISFGNVVFKSDEFFNVATKATYQEVLAGEFLINPINLNYDLKSLRTALSEINTCVSPAYIVLKAKGTPDKNFLKHQLHAFDLFHMKTLGAGVRQTITFADIGACRTYLPPLPEQTRIAEFLDRETAKIDELVAEQDRLIALLKEKRQAVISHAVTKGLNPKAPLKPSGIEWLGDVPAHWEVVALKHLVSRPIIDGPHESPEHCDEGIPFVSAESVSKGFVDFEKIWGYISPEDHARYSKRFAPQRGDILMVKLGATTGVSAIVETDKVFNIWVPLAAIRLQPEIDPRFILHVLRSDNLRRAYENTWTYGTQQTLGLQTISNLRVPFPPKEEREKIAKYIDSIVPAFELLTAEAERAIALLQERRTALISAAVTGQIDVRPGVSG